MDVPVLVWFLNISNNIKKKLRSFETYLRGGPGQYLIHFQLEVAHWVGPMMDLES